MRNTANFLEGRKIPFEIILKITATRSILRRPFLGKVQPDSKLNHFFY